MTFIAYVFLKLRNPKDVVRKMSKKSRLRESFDRNMVNEPKRWLNMNGTNFIKFIGHCEDNWV